MGTIEELYEKRKIFNHLFNTKVIAIVTSNYYYEDDSDEKNYEKIYVQIKSKINLSREEIVAEVTKIYGEIHEPISRFFRSSIPPQVFHNKYPNPFLRFDAKELLFEDRWNVIYSEYLCDKVEEKISSIVVEDNYGELTEYDIKVRDTYLIM